MSDETPKMELAPKEVFLSYFNGYAVYGNPNLANGWVQFRDSKGNIIGMIDNVGQIHIARRRSPS